MLRRRGGHKDVERRTIGHCTTLISETTHRGTPRLRLQAMRPSETMIASAISSCRGKCPRLSVINASKQQSVFRTGYRVVSSSVIMLISLAGLANAGKDAGNDAGYGQRDTSLARAGPRPGTTRAGDPEYYARTIPRADCKQTVRSDRRPLCLPLVFSITDEETLLKASTFQTDRGTLACFRIQRQSGATSYEPRK